MKKGGLITCNACTLSCCGICDCHLTLNYCKNVVESVAQVGAAGGNHDTDQADGEMSMFSLYLCKIFYVLYSVHI